MIKCVFVAHSLEYYRDNAIENDSLNSWAIYFFFQ